ncbi:YpdA family putative bacillithiol disulfide reductase [soil metagenome]
MRNIPDNQEVGKNCHEGSANPTEAAEWQARILRIPNAVDPNNPTLLDAAIIGAGPAGLAVAQTFHKAGIAYTVLERGPVAAHIAQYPHFMRFFSGNENLEIAGFPLGITEEKPSRREYLKYLTDFVSYHKLAVQTYTNVLAVSRQPDGSYSLQIERLDGTQAEVHARAVIVAVGAWDNPRKLHIPGGDLPKVHYRFTEPHPYVGRKVLVVGGRNSAVEAALLHWRSGVDVSLCYRRTQFDGVGLKYWLRPDIENRLQKGEITGYLGSNICEVHGGSVDIETPAGRVSIQNDFVLPFLGYDPPVKFLRDLGIKLEPETNRPAHNPATLESNVPGLFIAGAITNGNVSGKVFIENSRHHGELILPRLREIAASTNDPMVRNLTHQ